MARVVIAAYAIRFPVGGYLSWILQWLLGFERLGHDAYFVEKAGWANSCCHPDTGFLSDDCTPGVTAIGSLLSRYGLNGRWCFEDAGGRYHGMTRQEVEEVFRTADVFVDMGNTHGEWLDDARAVPVRVFVDGDPCYTQFRAVAQGQALDGYHYYYSVGQNVGRAMCPAPTLGKTWRPVFDPVVVELFDVVPVPVNAPFTTIMAWQTYAPVTFAGVEYGQKDVEFRKFSGLPAAVSSALEIAVAGDAPLGELRQRGWSVCDSLSVTGSFDRFREYIAASRGEFTVAKNVYVATRSGFFSERSAAYLASGRPVVMQDTGLSPHLPTGRGLFVVDSPEEAADSLERITRDYDVHSREARALARDMLSTAVVLPSFLRELGL